MKMVHLEVHELDDWPASYKDELTDPWAYEETSGDEVTVHVRGFVRISALQHELWHVFYPDQEHHSAWDFCIASYNPIRINYHGGLATRSLAIQLAETGKVGI